MQLSASSVTTKMSTAGTSPMHSTVTGAGLEAVGSDQSSVIAERLFRTETASGTPWPLLSFLVRRVSYGSVLVSRKVTRPAVSQTSAAAVKVMVAMLIGPAPL